jgi:hypothetical protein
VKLPARVTDPDGYPGVAVRVVRVIAEDQLSAMGYEVVGPDHIIRQFPSFKLHEGWPGPSDPYRRFSSRNLIHSS